MLLLSLLATPLVRTDRCGSTIWMVAVSWVMILLLLHSRLLLTLVCSTDTWRTRADNVSIAAKGSFTAAYVATIVLLFLLSWGGGIMILLLFSLIVAIFTLSSIVCIHWLLVLCHSQNFTLSPFMVEWVDSGGSSCRYFGLGVIP